MLEYFCVNTCQLFLRTEQYTVNVELLLFLLVINIELDKQCCNNSWFWQCIQNILYVCMQLYVDDQ